MRSATDVLVDFSEYGAGLGDALSVIRNNAVAAGLDRTVPTCPGWTVADLVRHLGTVQRWATGILSERDPHQAGIDAESSAIAISHAELLDWLDDGLVDLLNAIVRAPEDLSVFFFLKNSPPARVAWARRQCHEATIHAVDAMSARLGAAPAAAQTWISPALAIDGIDELLRGFLPRKNQRLRSASPLSVAVLLDDPDGGTDGGTEGSTDDGAVGGTSSVGWSLQISEDPVEVSLLDNIAAQGMSADVVVRGGAVPLYLGLWNRGDEFTVTGDEHWLDLWRSTMRIVWS